MSIQIDPRAGSSQFGPLLRRLGMEVDMVQMAYGDVSFTGLTTDGMPCSYGLELKSVADALACLTSGRFAGHQLPGLMNCFDHVWLLIYGQWRARVPDGVLEELRRGHGGGHYWAPAGGGQRLMMYRDFESWLLTCQIAGGLRVHRARDVEEAAQFIKLLYNWSQKEEHASHKIIFSGKHLWQDQALMVKPTLARRVAAELPSIGVKRSADVARVFHTLEEMVEAEPKDWMKVPGIGRGIAQKIYKAIHQNGNGGGK